MTLQAQTEPGDAGHEGGDGVCGMFGRRAGFEIERAREAAGKLRHRDVRG
jgi:hypothetical protein